MIPPGIGRGLQTPQSSKNSMLLTVPVWAIRRRKVCHFPIAHPFRCPFGNTLRFSHGSFRSLIFELWKLLSTILVATWNPTECKWIEVSYPCSHRFIAKGPKQTRLGIFAIQHTSPGPQVNEWRVPGLLLWVVCRQSEGGIQIKSYWMQIMMAKNIHIRRRWLL